MEAVVGGSLTPPGRAWLADLHLEFAGAPVFPFSLRIPVSANALLRVWLEGRAEVVLPAPVVILLAGAVRARVGPIILGLRAFNTRKQSSLLLSLGVRLDGSGDDVDDDDDDDDER